MPAEDADASILDNRVPRAGALGNEDVLPLLPDQQGQVQYTGPASSFSFHLKLRALFDNYSTYEFVLFGPNATEDVEGTPESAPGRSCGGPIQRLEASTSSPEHAIELAVDMELFENLVDSYFDQIHSDFPVLHEASFRATYESWARSPTSNDRVWLCSLLCVFMLARRTADREVTRQQEHAWWRQIQALLPTVLFTSSISAIQALMLAALHLHNTNHRDACWNLTGTAVRIAHAIGLHSDEIKSHEPPLTRELRKSLWWILFSFEMLQISSYDRPTSIHQAECCVSCPDERIMGMGSCCPPVSDRGVSQFSI
jgi:hypothetical protein